MRLVITAIFVQKKFFIRIFMAAARKLTTAKKKRRALTVFEQSVLKITSTIPLGETRSYTWVARKIGRPKAIRAVGQALKKNPYPLLIPCHRVIHKDGRLGGYVWGVKTKKVLLSIEKDMVK
ncbi:MAG: MGMT family protein [Candidatus Omnitrophica bacterium]|nr:MGMT family protein [Candidatus Omnitrophota bacterium]